MGFYDISDDYGEKCDFAMSFSSKEHKASLISDLMRLYNTHPWEMEGFITPCFINRESEASEEDYMIKVRHSARTGWGLGLHSLGALLPNAAVR